MYRTFAAISVIALAIVGLSGGVAHRGAVERTIVVADSDEPSFNFKRVMSLGVRNPPDRGPDGLDPPRDVKTTGDRNQSFQQDWKVPSFGTEEPSHDFERIQELGIS